MPVEVEWQTSNFIQHGHDLNLIKESNGCIIVCEQNLDLGKVSQIKIDIEKFEDWFVKNSKRIIQDTTNPYKNKDKTRLNPKLWLTYISKKGSGDSDFKKALKAHTWGVHKNYSKSVINQITQIKNGDLIVFVGVGKGFPGRINIKSWSKKSFKGYFERLQVFRITSDYFYDEEKIIWKNTGKHENEVYPHRFEFDPIPITDVKNIQINVLNATSKQELHKMVFANFIEGNSATLLDCIFHGK